MAQPSTEVLPEPVWFADRENVTAAEVVSYATGSLVPAATQGVPLSAGPNNTLRRRTLPRRNFTGMTVHVKAKLSLNSGGTPTMTLDLYGQDPTGDWYLVANLNNKLAISAANNPGCFGANDAGGSDGLFVQPVDVGATFKAYTVVVRGIAGTASRVDTELGFSAP